MKRLLSILLLLCAARSYGAAGDVLWATVETNGWVLDVDISLIGTNGAFAFGWNASNQVSKSTCPIVLKVASAGYNSSGATQTVSRVIYGTMQLRLPYPNDALNDVTPNVLDAKIRLALSDYLYQKDSIISCSMLGSWYSNCNANASVTSTNNSTLAYFNSVANWKFRGGYRITNSTMQLTAYAAHNSGIACVGFSAKDQHSHTVTATATASYVRDPLTGCCEVVYTAPISMASFNNLDLIRCDFTAYPNVGDSGSALSTTDNVNADPTPLYASITNMCDRLMAWGLTFASVDPTNGSDSLGLVVTNGFNLASPPYPFLTIDGAMTKMAITNKNFCGHNDCGGGVVYLTNGTYAFTGGSGGSYGTNVVPFASLVNYPGVLPTNVIISSAGPNKFIGDRVLVSGVNIQSATTITFSGGSVVVMTNCIINATASALVYQVVNWLMYDCYGMQLVQGYATYSPYGVQCSPAVVSGNILAPIAPGNLYTFCGNYCPPTWTNTTYFGTWYGPTQIVPISTGAIIQGNAFFGYTNNGESLVFAYYTETNLLGAAFFNNIFENKSSGMLSALVGISADAATNQVNNILFFNNTLKGQRFNGAYQSKGTNYILKTGWFFKNNIFDNFNIKTDTFTSDGGASGARTGNWSEMWGVGCSGNLNINVLNEGFFQNFTGLNSDFPGNYYSNFTRLASYLQPVNDLSYNNITTGAGGGNYRLQTSSPGVVINPVNVPPVPFDIEGQYRGLADPPGAYASASPRKSGMFFGN